LGYTLIADLWGDMFFCLVGPGGSGKTTMLEAHLGMLGAANWSQVTLQDLAENRFAPARLENKLVGAFDDLDSTALKSVSKIKALTGGFPWLDVERKCRDAYRAPLYARLIFTCNEMPRSPDKSEAWYDRVCLIPFQRRFRDTVDEDRNMPAKLATPEARQALFALAVAGLRTLADNEWRFPEPQSVGVELSEYRCRNDSIAAFMEDRCLRGPDMKVQRTQWYEAYKQWCEASGLHPVGRNIAYQHLRDEFGCSDQTGHAGGRSIVGIALLTEERSIP